MKKSINFSYFLVLVAVLVAALFIMSCDGCDEGSDTTGTSAPAVTTTAVTVNTTAATKTTTAGGSSSTTSTSASTKKTDKDGAGWVTDKNGNPAYY